MLQSSQEVTQRVLARCSEPTLDLSNPPTNEDGSIDHSQDFFGKETNLTVSGQSRVKRWRLRLETSIHLDLRSVLRTLTQPDASEFLMIEPKSQDLADDMDAAGRRGQVHHQLHA